MLSKEYAPHHRTALHKHARTQFLFATCGTMKARTQRGWWIVPPTYGLLVPDGIEHDVEMLGRVALRSAYIQSSHLPIECLSTCRVIQVSTLLSACIERLATRPLEYDEKDIAASIANVIIAEISATPPSSMALPFPKSTRLCDMTDALLENPSDSKSINDWAFEMGMSRRTFTRAFRHDTGMSFDQWRQLLRFQAATQLMASGLPLSHIAPKVGYGSVASLKAMMHRIR